MRILSLCFASILLAAPAVAEKPTPELKISVEDDTYRFGDLYRSERGTTVEACAQMCNADRACASWSLTPATFRIGPRCELKRNPGQASLRPGATSGMSEFWQMDPARHGEMLYQPKVPESRQPAAVPVDQLQPSPLPRTFGEPLPVREPELQGGPEVIASFELVPTPMQPAAKPATIQQVEVLRGPGQGVVPDYVKQPAPEDPHLLYRKPVRASAPTTFKDPSTAKAPPAPQSADFNAVEKRESQKVAAPAAPASPPPAQPAKAAPARLPWTERDGAVPDYSVGGKTYVPGDEDATAGFVEGLPAEAGS